MKYKSLKDGNFVSAESEIIRMFDWYEDFIDVEISDVRYRSKITMDNNLLLIQTHKGNLLFKILPKFNISQEEAEQETLRFLREHVKKNSSPLCGNTVWHDRKFLTLYMPELEDYFHYRCIDVSSVKELTKRWRPEISMQHTNKTAAHRAQADVYESINELRFYRDTIFAKSG